MTFAQYQSPLIAASVLALMLARVLHFHWSNDASLIGIIPDDAFYYIQLARHRVTDGFWTFDGMSPATGFHLLYGYFLVVVFSVFGDIGWRQLYIVIGLLAAISTSCQRS